MGEQINTKDKGGTDFSLQHFGAPGMIRTSDLRIPEENIQHC